ncbi:hypothetical protein MRX96_025707 [Rhipicephalus microplus]
MNRRLGADPYHFNSPGSRKVAKRPKRSEPKGTLSRLQPNDIVSVRDEEEWSRKATVLEQTAPRFYRVLSENGEPYRRNRQHLQPTSEAFSSRNLSDDGMTEDVQPTSYSEVPRTPDQDQDGSAGSFALMTNPVEPDNTADSTPTHSLFDDL